MAAVRDFWAKVSFTDADGEHAAGTLVRVPYESDAQIAAAQSMLSYGVLTDKAPPPQPVDEHFVVFTPPDEAAPVDLTPNDEGVASTDTPPVEVAKDDPETPYFDARDSDGQFVAEGTPLDEEPTKPPAKKAARKKR